MDIIWSNGTAHDFFISLSMLYNPQKYSLRAAWAAGMRSRLPVDERNHLEELSKALLLTPKFHWLHTLPAPCDACAALDALAAMEPVERLLTFECNPHADDSLRAFLLGIIERGTATEAEAAHYRELVPHYLRPSTTKKAHHILKAIWANAATYGDYLLKGLSQYYREFFVQEEKRIKPVLEEGLLHAQQLAEVMTVEDLIEELSEGVTVEPVHHYQRIVLAPSYWSSPLIWFGPIDEETVMLVFGTRPADASLIPGEVVPDTLVRGMKALGDPTRLRIMHYLANDALTPTQLAKLLRLRAPTVVHHLDKLRQAGLVRVQLIDGKNKIYAARTEMVDQVFDQLKEFISYGGGGDFVDEDTRYAVAAM